MKKKHENNKIIISIIFVLLIILLVIGGTYAYWTWTSNTTERTNVSFQVTGGEFAITGAVMSANKLVPIAACHKVNGTENGTYTYVGKSTVTAKNDTNNAMTATLKLEAQFASGSTVTTTEKAYFKYAVSEVSTASTSASSTLCGATGVTSGGYKTGTFGSVAVGSYTDIVSDLTFSVPANTTVTKYYHVYIWLDKESAAATSQNQTLNVRWSTDSTMA